MKPCFAYIRVSTVKQGEGVSLEAQQEAIAAFAARNGLSVTEWFEEKQTAAKRGRPVFSAMIRQLQAGNASGVIMHKIDRSARNFADWAKIGDLSDAGVDVYFANESLDFRSRGGRLSADIQAVIAADYIRNLREETIKGVNGRLNQGLYPFGAPIGYLDNGKGKPKTPDPERAPYIVSLFELYASEQFSIKALVHEMKRRGLQNRNGQPVSKRGIETILANPFYCGLIKIKTTGRTYDGCHEPLISVSLFKRVGVVKDGRSGKKVTRHNHLFRGLFRCRLCDAAMTPEKQKGHIYYRCQTQGCPTKTVREERLDSAIAEQLKRSELTDENIAVLSREVEAWVKERDQNDRQDNLAMQLAKTNVKLDTLDDKLIENVIDNATYHKKRTDLLVDKAALEEEVRIKAKKANDPDHTHKFLELVKSIYLNYVFAIGEEKRQIVRLATSNRFVSPKKIEVATQNWLTVVENAVNVICCDPHRPTSRTSGPGKEEMAEKLIDVSLSQDWERLLECRDTGHRSVPSEAL